MYRSNHRRQVWSMFVCALEWKFLSMIILGDGGHCGMGYVTSISCSTCFSIMQIIWPNDLLRWPIKPCKSMTFQKKVLTLSNWLVTSRNLQMALHFHDIVSKTGHLYQIERYNVKQNDNFKKHIAKWEVYATRNSMMWLACLGFFIQNTQ